MLPLLLSVLCHFSGPALCAAAQEAAPGQPRPLKRVAIDRDNLEIRESCILVAGEAPILDLDDNGVVHVLGDGLRLEFEGPPQGLRGAPLGQAPENYQGLGIVIRGQGVQLQAARVSGFRVGIQAQAADRLQLLNCDVSDNRRQKLRSTPAAEALEDWLRPHDNDEGQWAARYGAGIQIQGGEFVSVSGCRAREVQNGLILERTRGALVSDNDFSFLSGWGIALWRANQNFITRNAVDFCIRGYSHGVYNRGQDSAGILLFEQCSNNVIAENSATHSGDGLFAFAGQEALGESGPAQLERRRLGNNDNIIARNDLSYAAAHGLELTFSFGNKVFRNRMVGNGICGIWGGYSRETVLSANLLVDNGHSGAGSEGGGINIEHGQENYILNNEFLGNSVGVRLWWDEDPGLAKLPWTLANGFGSGDNLLVSNRFGEGPLGIELLQAGPTTLASNEFQNIEVELRADEASQPQRLKSIGLSWEEPEFPVFGESRPVGAHPEWDGRESILMGEYGPADLALPGLWRLPGGGDQHAYRLVGPGLFEQTRGSEGLRIARDGERLLVRAKSPGVQTYELSVTHRAAPGAAPTEFTAQGLLVGALWRVRFFAWQHDPREDLAAWRAESLSAVELSLPELDLAFGYGGPAQALRSSRALSQEAALEALAPDRFGSLAETELDFPAGRWRLDAVADDGLRVWIDDELRIDAWKHQGATAYHADFELEAARKVRLRVEHFEIDGAARLSVRLQAAP